MTFAKKTIMIRKIICPTDLSPAANNAVAYAAQLCQVLQAQLELLHVAPVEAGKPLLSGPDLLDVVEMPEELGHLCNSVKKKWGISCTYKIETGDAPFEDVVSAAADKQSLIVAGTNGADNFFQRIFGANAVNIAWHAQSHVLLVPENVKYTPVRCISFGWDYHDRKPLIHEARFIAKALGCRLELLHISHHPSLVSKDVFRAQSELVKEQIGDELLDFRRVYGRYVGETLDSVMHDYKSEILAISLRNGRLLREIFRNVRGKYSLPAYPVLILHPKVPVELVL